MKIETQTKRKIYLACSILLGVLLATIAHALIEKNYINNLLAEGTVPVRTWTSNCFLPGYLSLAFLAVGIIFGYVIGVRWWQVVYVEKCHWRMKRKK